MIRPSTTLSSFLRTKTRRSSLIKPESLRLNATDQQKRLIILRRALAPALGQELADLIGQQGGLGVGVAAHFLEFRFQRGQSQQSIGVIRLLRQSVAVQRQPFAGG